MQLKLGPNNVTSKEPGDQYPVAINAATPDNRASPAKLIIRIKSLRAPIAEMKQTAKMHQKKIAQRLMTAHLF